jgi:ribonuclease BN (tRNA processing enzyme)
VPHGSRPALGWRFQEREGGPVLAYSGDTGEGPGAVETGRDADLFVLECTLPEGEAPEKHLTASAAGRVAAAAGCRRLLLVHLSAQVDGTPVEERVRASYSGPLALASDGLEADI